MLVATLVTFFYPGMSNYQVADLGRRHRGRRRIAWSAASASP
jgi:hypothetical protein